MPLCKLYTNVSKVAARQGPEALLTALTEAAASSIGKSTEKFVVLVNFDATMSATNSTEPAVFGEVRSIGFIGGDKNAAISAALAAVIESHLGIPATRTFFNFTDMAATDWGTRGSTVAALGLA